MDSAEGLNARVITNNRIIKTNRDSIFRAFSSPQLLKNWWGPNGFTNTFIEFNFSEGGVWEFIMHGPDGRSYNNVNYFRQITPLETIVIEHIYEPHFVLTVTLTEVPDGTQIHWHMLFDTPEIKEALAPLVVNANEQNLDRLTAELLRIV